MMLVIVTACSTTSVATSVVFGKIATLKDNQPNALVGGAEYAELPKSEFRSAGPAACRQLWIRSVDEDDRTSTRKQWLQGEGEDGCASILAA